MLLLDQLVERWNCLRHEVCPRFNWKEDALEPGIVVILLIPFSQESGVNFPVNCHELCKHVSIFSMRHFEIRKSENLALIFLILKLHDIIRIRNDKKYNVLIFLV